MIKLYLKTVDYDKHVISAFLFNIGPIFNIDRLSLYKLMLLFNIFVVHYVLR